MAVHHAVLALLATGPSHGYELKAQFEQAVGPQWGEVNLGHLYQVLDRLHRDGLVSHRHVPQDHRPDRTEYRLTEQGRAELDSWLAAPPSRPGGYRDDFFLKIMAAARVEPPVLHTVLRAQRQTLLEEMRSLSDLRRTHQDDPVVVLLIEAAVLHTEASLRLVDVAEEQAPSLAKHAQRAASEAVPRRPAAKRATPRAG